MAKVKSDADAESIIRSFFSGDASPRPYNFQISKQGSDWVVRFSLRSNTEQQPEEQEWYVDSGTGRARFSKITSPASGVFQKEVPVAAKAQVIPEDKPREKQATVPLATDDYRANAKQTIEGEISGLIQEEIRSAVRELAEEQTKAISETVEQYKATIRQVVEDEKVAIRGSVEEVRRKIVAGALG